MDVNDKSVWEGFKALEWHVSQAALFAISMCAWVVGIHDIGVFFSIVTAAPDNVDPDTTSIVQACVAIFVGTCAMIFYQHRRLNRAKVKKDGE
jgi:hypothetical protein